MPQGTAGRRASSSASGEGAGGRRGGFRWRKWNRILHRDLGYLCAALTLIYAVSGIAVNHVSDWNPNYDIREETVAFPGIAAPPGSAPAPGAAPASGAAPEPGSDAWARAALAALDVDADYRGTYRPEPGTVDIFVDGGTVTVEPAAGRATLELVRPRPLLRPANFLHLNEAKGLWTWMADLYAVALFLLALTGLFVIKGRKGITGRGAWLTGIGLAVPLLFLLLYY